jgi:acyl carrier protein
MDMVGTLRDYVANELMTEKPSEPIGENDNLLSSGALDSMGLLQLVAFIEDKFGVTISSDEFHPDNFQSLSAIANLIEKKRK